MAGVAQIDWQSLANEAHVRALLEDLISYYRGVYEGRQLALAVWFHKSPEGSEHHLLALFAGPPLGRIAVSERQSLLWKTAPDQPPFANISATSVADFARLLDSTPDSLNPYREGSEVIHFDSRLLPMSILQFFGVITEPPGLIKVWCLSEDQYVNGQTIRSLLASRSGIRQEVGIVKTYESPDFENCRAILHFEVSRQWLPAIPEGIVQRCGFYEDWEAGRPSYLLAEGGALYRIIKFEVIHAPQYAGLVLERRPDDRYLEVYLRAVHPSEQPAA
jgi:hypothetical protein